MPFGRNVDDVLLQPALEAALEAGWRISTDRAEARADAYLTVLRALEWSGDLGSYVCPCCRASRVRGHEDGCKLAELLKVSQ